MVPTLGEGTAVRIRPVPAGRIRVGRIAVFQKEDLLVIHRLIWKQDRDGVTLYLFKGDNGTRIDHVSPERISVSTRLGSVCRPGASMRTWRRVG